MCSMADAADVVWFDGQQPVTYQVQGKSTAVVATALDMFAGDMQLVTGQRAVSRKGGTIQIFQLDQNRGAIGKLRKMGVPVDSIVGRHDAFYVGTGQNSVLVVGSNGRGCAYGILELSRKAGVSPWVWWGDVSPQRRPRLVFGQTDATLQSPSVAYRGIFINDEDWSLRNWAWKTFEKSDKFGTMGPKTYKAVFQLLLRLRANAIWPAMHSGTPGFFTIKGNKEMADSCGILIGTSHCEPLLRNNVAEWDHSVRGAYNYITNRPQVQQYWAERLQQVKGSEEFFTIGMRGIHDGSMEGVKTKEEKLDGLQQVIDDQRELIRKYYHKDVEKVPQVFIPYKEVLEIMESGLRVPDDVTLMWCDDNYGYMTRLSDKAQQQRSGGGGVYYHLSYWGRPHDYLWLTTTQPGLIYSEMKAAYDHNCRRLWIANVHDPKVAAYDLEFFLDMAWNIDAIQPNTIGSHLQRWLCTQFGQEVGQKLFPAMYEFYHLCAIRKPEFMGWTQVELDKKVYPRGLSQVTGTEFTNEFDGELRRYLSAYEHICLIVKEAERLVRPELKDAFFAHVKYPVLSARAMAVKMLEAQEARSKYQGQTEKAMEGREDYMLRASARAIQAYREIQNLTTYYNDTLASGKWKGIMNMMPRDLPVFTPPSVPYLPKADYQPGYGDYLTHPAMPTDAIARNACRYQSATAGVQPIQMLGHSMKAVSIPKGGEVVYEFDTSNYRKGEGDAVLYTAMIPTQPNDKGDLRYQVTLDDQPPVVISLKEKYRSDFWKTSVLRGQALKQTPVKVQKGRHTLRVKALDDHIIFDQWMLDFKPGRRFYVIPTQHEMAKEQGANIVFIGNSITYGALHQQRELTAPPTRCAQWLSRQAGIDTVYFRNCGRSGKTTYHFLPRQEDVVPEGDKTYFADVVAKTRELVSAHPTLPLVFSIMLGTNDTVERPRNKHTTPDDYANNLCAIIDSLLALWPNAHVVLNKPIWYTPDYVTKNKSVGTKQSLELLDAYFKTFPQVMSRCKPGHVHIGDNDAYRYFEKHWQTDIIEEKDSRNQSYWLHPNEQGAAKLAEFWGKAILPVVKGMAGSDPLFGKQIGVIGDSYVRNHREPIENTWHYKFAQKHGMQYFNYGRNGNCIALDLKQWGTGMYRRYQEMKDSLDYVVVIAGHNDASQGRLDSIGIGTFKERLGILCRGLKAKYPRARILFFTPWTCENFEGSPRQQVVDAMIEVCGGYGIPIFDAARHSNIPAADAEFRKKYFQGGKGTDTAHLNARGHDLFLPVAEQFILNSMKW